MAGTAAYQYVASRPDVDPETVAVMAYSFGGYYAPRIAAFEPRYSACVVFGTVAWDIHANPVERKRFLDTDPKKTSQSPFQFPWVLGVKDMDEVHRDRQALFTRGCAGPINCPFLVTHGSTTDSPLPDAHEASRSGRLEAKPSRSSPSTRAVPSIATSTTARSASTTSPTGSRTFSNPKTGRGHAVVTAWQSSPTRLMT